MKRLYIKRKFMMRYVLVVAMIFTGFCGFAQFPGGGQGRAGGGAGAGAGRQNMNMGHMYGRVVDSKTGKSVDAASVQFTGNKFDTATKKMKQVILATLLTDAHGDFSAENLPLFGNLNLHISVIGYTDFTQQVSFGIKFGGQGGAANTNVAGQSQQDRMQQLIGMADKDLGNIKIVASEGNNLTAVTVTSTKPFFEMGIDKKIFNVDKNLVSTGQTATEVMKQIPSLNVDIDGNVTMRNATPTLFIDGRPTTLTLDQIPADIIDKVELITNPSAKYDASGGGAGILNIILKKNLKKGYNGGIRAGVDSRGRINTGGDFNLRQGKLNFFLTGVYNQRLTKYTSQISKNDDTYNPLNSVYTPFDSVHTNDIGQNKGAFGFVRFGVDYFVDNRNTISLALNYNKGGFNGADNQTIDSTVGNQFYSSSLRTTATPIHVENFGGMLSFKHNFTKSGHDITADLNYNQGTNNSISNYVTNTYLEDRSPKYSPFLQQTISNGNNKFVTIQSDYENPITDNIKLEAGVRAQIRDIKSLSDQYVDSSSEFVYNPNISSNYKFEDQVYAGYVNYSMKAKKLSYQVGLRAESSNYKGTQLDSNLSFKEKYPLSLFPSAFITYKLSDADDIQVNYTRRINRPNFGQLIPSVNITDPTNPRVGNPNLTPEFTNSFELSYDKTYAHNSNFLASAYVRYTTDLITTFYYRALSPTAPIKGPYTSQDTVNFVTFENANSSLNYGLELTNRTTILKIWDMMVNVNLFNSIINGSNLQNGLNNQRVSWFAKLNNSFKLPKKFTFQLSATYNSKTIIAQGGGGPGGGGGGGGFFGGGVASSAQGYIYAYYDIDAAIKKDWAWKGGNSASITLSMGDIFRTAMNKTYSSSLVGDTYFDQLSIKRRDPQLVRLNFSYRFGKFDADLFKRKNNKQDTNGGAEMPVQ